MARTCNDSACRWIEPILVGNRNHTYLVAAETYSVLCGEQREYFELEEDEPVPEEEDKVDP